MPIRRRLIALVLGASSVILLANARGQAPAPGTAAVKASPAKKVRPSAPPDLPENVFAGALTVQDKPPAAAAAEAKKQEHLQKIRQLTFDRRPSAILKAWSTPRDEAIKQADNPANAAFPGAMPMPAQASVLRRAQPVAVAKAAQPAVVAGPVVAAAPGVTPAPAGPDPFDRELKGFQYDVTRGDWMAVKAFLAKLPEEEGKAAYEQLIQGLGNPPGMQGNNMQMQMQMQQMQQMQMQMQMNMGMRFGMNPNAPPFQQFMMERNVFANRDVFALAGAAPHGLDDERLTGLGKILRLALDGGNVIEDFVGRLREVLKLPPKEAPLNGRHAVKLLFAADCPVEAGEFLPAPEKAEADNDREALNLLARHYLALHDRDKKTAHMEQAWRVTQAALAAGKIEPAQKEEAIRRAVELTPKLREALGRAWLEESFTSRPDRGMEIIAAIGSSTSQGLMTRPFDDDFRLKSIELQKLAVDALLRKAPRLGKDWAGSLALLAESWLREAEFSFHYDMSTSLGPQMQFDAFGNIYYTSYDPGMPNMARQRGLPVAIKVGEVVKNRPGDDWLGFVDEGMKPKFATVFAELYLKVNEEEKAFPYIEQLSKTNPRKAKDLAEEFVRIWTKNHDPNSQQLRRSRFFYIYGFDNRAEGIPLTRSKQERNIVELGQWIKRLKRLPIGELDEKLLTKAFTACHSTAEVYRLDAIERVFGTFDSLKPLTLAELIQQMRGNLVGVWRQPAEQEKNKTKRREKDIRAEVLRGYEVARAVIDRGLAQHPDHWALVLARATILHDENNYRQQIERSAEFAPRRQKAFAEFRRAAELYAAAVPRLEQADERTDAFDYWFCASVGASDPQHITEETLTDPRQAEAIRRVLGEIKGEAGDRHRARFANALFTRLTQIKPPIKYRYLKAGIEVVGDHPQAFDARKVFDYYKDVVTEIKLEAKIDGSDMVGHDRPFGLFVNIKHTREIERESGGFGRYLQNQNNNNNYYYYNFGRPLENYRDKFQDAAKLALGEHFEILSVTFQDEKVNSRATEEYGWRYTPYAYLLLKARSPKVDKVPPLRLDLDFMDTSGYVILPVESPTIPVDASPSKAPSRPFEKLQLTQILDERQAKDGKLIVEVKGVARGLVPELEEIVALEHPGFKVEKVEDQGLSVSKFDPESEANVIDSERTWLVSYRAAEGQPAPPSTFRFGTSKVDGAETVYQRYVDADLSKVGPEVSLESHYEQPRRDWVWWAGGGSLALAFLAIAIAKLRSGPRGAVGAKYRMPEPVTAFTVLGLLREIQRQESLPPAQMLELADAIDRVERHYFAGSDGESIDLHGLAETWVRRAS